MSSGPNIARAARKRRKVEVSLSDDSHRLLEALAEAGGTSRSRIVETALVMFALDGPYKLPIRFRAAR